jgi:hypothetical protein
MQLTEVIPSSFARVNVYASSMTLETLQESPKYDVITHSFNYIIGDHGMMLYDIGVSRFAWMIFPKRLWVSKGIT